MKSPVWQEKPLTELRGQLRGAAQRAALDALLEAGARRGGWSVASGLLGNQYRVQFLQGTTRQPQCWMRVTQRKLVLCIPDDIVTLIPGAPRSLQQASGHPCHNASGALELTVKGREPALLLADLIFDTAGADADPLRESALRGLLDLDPTLRQRLLAARHGQGEFRERVAAVEPRCRVCGVLDRRQLRAVHIKPWRVCSEAEMLDGNNGLLLSPHVAHLFERGHIGFADDGTLLVSRHLNPAVLKAWGISRTLQVGSFLPAQCAFLDYHRKWVFEHGQGGRRVASNPSGD
ncbi:MAG TPA: HNH endonuclease [Steroidobacteraceae bacterium]|nr:HNH endonuclease [Steroidobacteraceae bacterium]